MQGALLTYFYDSVVASAIFYGAVCWSSIISAAGRKRFDKRIKKASSTLGCPVDPVQVVGESGMMVITAGEGVPPPAGHYLCTGQLLQQ